MAPAISTRMLSRASSSESPTLLLISFTLSPLAMAIMWYHDIIPGPLALIFSLQDFGSFLWTLFTWRAEQPNSKWEKSL